MTTGLRLGALALLFLLPTITAVAWVGSAKQRLAALEAQEAADTSTDKVAVATAADESYCTPELKKILRRVLQSCGLLGSGGGRGCQPLEAKNVATLSGGDFNALFTPMKHRGGIVQFEQGLSTLDPADQQLIDNIFSDQRGASYFFVVARASPEGSVLRNRELSKDRAEAVLAHLREKFNDPDLDREVGLLWLGEEFAQLEQMFCDWQRSQTASELAAESGCKSEDLNRSAFIAWIDCRL